MTPKQIVKAIEKLNPDQMEELVKLFMAPKPGSNLCDLSFLASGRIYLPAHEIADLDDALSVTRHAFFEMCKRDANRSGKARNEERDARIIAELKAGKKIAAIAARETRLARQKDPDAKKVSEAAVRRVKSRA